MLLVFFVFDEENGFNMTTIWFRCVETGAAKEQMY